VPFGNGVARTARIGDEQNIHTGAENGDCIDDEAVESDLAKLLLKLNWC
jgi:hypothetical protein